MSRHANKKPKPRRLRNQQGHPARQQAQRSRYGPPDANELEIREIVRLVRHEATANPHEKQMVGPLAAAAKRAAEVLCERVAGLDDDEHRLGVANYLTERLGDVLDDFSIVEYRNWRQRCLAEAKGTR